MKKILLILLLLVVIPIVNAETIIDNYKVEITIDKDDVFKVRESFMVLKSDEDKYYIKSNTGYEYSYNANMEEFTREYGNKSKFQLRNNSYYFINYYFKDKYANVNDYESFQFYPIEYASLIDEESITYNNFQFIITLEDGVELDINDIYNFNDLVVERDGNVITGIYRGSISDLKTVIIKKKVVKKYIEEEKEDKLIPINIVKRFSLYVPVIAMLINILLIIIFKINTSGDIDGNNGEKRELFAKIMITVVIISYLISLNYISIINKSFYILIFSLIITSFYIPFYSQEFFNKNVYTEYGGGKTSKLVAYLIDLFTKIFILFHSSIFALFFCFGFNSISIDVRLLYFYLGFILNAINLEMISIFKNRISKNSEY